MASASLRTSSVASKALNRALLYPQNTTAYARPICISCSRNITTSTRFNNHDNGSTQTSRPRQYQKQQLKQTRTFTTSPHHSKSSSNPKSRKKSPPVTTHAPTNSSSSGHVPDNKKTKNLDSEPDPYDHSALQSAIDMAVARLRDALTKTRDAGRVTVEMIESLPMDVNQKGADAKGGAAHKERLRVRDVATVVPKGGRTMQVFVSTEEHVKAVSAAVQASQYSLVPQPDAQNPMLLIVPVPPATTETRNQAVAEAKKCFDRASLDVRNARGDAQKVFRKLEITKVVVPDELKKAQKGMEDVAKKGQDEVKRVYDGAVKALQSS